MAKDRQLSKLVFFGDVVWNPGRNYRKEARDKPNIDKLTDCMVIGWRSNVDPVIGMEVGGLDFDEAEVNQAVESRQLTYMDLKEKAKNDSNYRHDLAAFELLFCDGHKKVVRPRYAASSCFGRAGVYPAALARFLALKESQNKMSEAELEALKWNPRTPNVKDREPVVAVPMILHSFSSEEERLEEQIKENTLKLEGNLPTSDLDNLRAAFKLFTTSIKPESYFRATFNASLGVKYYAVCFLNLRYPQLRLMDRLLSEPSTPGHVPIKNVNFEKVQQFKVRVLAQEGLGKKSKTPREPIEISELEAYFNNPTGSENKIISPVGKKAWEAVAQGTNNEVIKKIATGHLTNNLDFVTQVMRPNTDQFNLVLELIEAGKADLVKDILTKIKEGVNFLEVIQERDTLKVKVDELGTALKNQEETFKVEMEAKEKEFKAKLAEATAKKRQTTKV